MATVEVWKVARSMNRRKRYITSRRPGNLTSYSSGERSWWSKMYRFPKSLQKPADDPRRLRRVAGVDHVEAPADQGDPDAQQERTEKGVEVLADETELGPRIEGHPIPIDVDALEPLPRGVQSLHLGTDHADPVAGALQRGRLHPDPAVEGDRQVLDEDQDPSTSRFRHSSPTPVGPRSNGRNRSLAGRVGGRRGRP